MTQRHDAADDDTTRAAPEGRIASVPTRAGRAGLWDHLFFGYRHFRDLAGHESFTGLLAMAVRGEPVSEDVVATLDEIAAVTTFADPRIWPLKVTRVVAAYGSALPALAVGSLVLESSVLGPWTMTETAQSVARVAAGGDAAGMTMAARELVRSRPRLLGFGVPYRPVDERLEALRRCLERRGRTGLRYWRAAEVLSGVVRAERSVEPNVGLGVAAACLDLGFAPDEVPAIGVAIAQHTFLATAMEGARQQPAVLQELPAAAIRYVGRSARSSRDGARAARGAAHEPRGRVLVVDDEPLVARSVARALGPYDILVATGGREAVQRIESGDRFDAIVCDLMMPEVSGMDLFDRVRALAPDQARRIIFLTGGAYTRDADAFLSSVPNPRLEKPFDPSAMLAAVAEMLS